MNMSGISAVVAAGLLAAVGAPAMAQYDPSQPRDEYYQRQPARRYVAPRFVPQLRDQGRYRTQEYRTGRAYEGLMDRWRDDPTYLPGVGQPAAVYLSRWSDGDSYFEGSEGRLRLMSPYHRGDEVYESVSYAERLWDGARYIPGVGWNFDDYRNVEAVTRGPAEDPDPTRVVSGTVLGIEQVEPTYGSPVAVRMQLRTDDGQFRTLQLGDRDYVAQHLPDLRQGERVRVRGRMVQLDGRRLFHAEDVEASGGQFQIPEYGSLRTVAGELVGIQEVVSREGEPQAVVAQVQTETGQVVNVLLGSAVELRRQNSQIQPGDRVAVRGFSRRVNGAESFIVQDVQQVQPPAVYGGYFEEDLRQPQPAMSPRPPRWQALPQDQQYQRQPQQPWPQSQQIQRRR